MTEAAWVALAAAVAAIVAAIPPTLLALAALKKSSSTNDKVDAASSAAKDRGAILAAKTDQIHELTNSRMAEVARELALARQKIESLSAQVTELKVAAVPAKTLSAVASAPAKTL